MRNEAAKVIKLSFIVFQFISKVAGLTYVQIYSDRPTSTRNYVQTFSNPEQIRLGKGIGRRRHGQVLLSVFPDLLTLSLARHYIYDIS